MMMKRMMMRAVHCAAESSRPRGVAAELGGGAGAGTVRLTPCERRSC